MFMLPGRDVLRAVADNDSGTLTSRETMNNADKAATLSTGSGGCNLSGRRREDREMSGEWRKR